MVYWHPVVLTIILIAVLRARRETHPRLPPERYAELNSYLTDENAIRHQLHMGNKINAIKLYRQLTGVGLKEAKEAIDRMMLEMKVSFPETSNQIERGQVNPGELQRLILAGQKINAIKYYREATGVGLKEAKEAVDWLEAQMKQNM